MVSVCFFYVNNTVYQRGLLATGIPVYSLGLVLLVSILRHQLLGQNDGLKPVKTGIDVNQKTKY